MNPPQLRTYSPIVLVAYARADHLRRTLDALAANPGARHSELLIYCDGARGTADQEAVLATRAVAWGASGFRSVSIIEREKNIGLAQNIISAVSETIDAHGRVIVVEDDIVTAPDFLDYMNRALDTYRDRHEVYHISGWNYPIDPTGLEDAFFLRVMNCWGWATWADRWQHFRREPQKLLAEFSPAQHRTFNLDGTHDFIEQIESNAAGRKTTWAIFWYAAIFLRGGLCLNPTRSLVENIGFDGTGENCGSSPITQAGLARRTQISFPETVRENEIAVGRIKQTLYRPLRQRVASRLGRMVKRLRRFLSSAGA